MPDGAGTGGVCGRNVIVGMGGLLEGVMFGDSNTELRGGIGGGARSPYSWSSKS